MPIQAPQWTDFRLCPVCQNEYNSSQRPPISLGCGHTICQSCLFRLSKQQCPFDQADVLVDISKLPINYGLLSLVGGKRPDFIDVDIPVVQQYNKEFNNARKAIEVLAQTLQNVVITGTSSSGNSYNTGNGSLTRPMQRKLVTLLHSQLAEEEGRARAMRSARSIGERAVKELILMHQSPQTLSAALWAAVRQRGCQFLGPAMQEAVLRLILLSLEDGISLSRKVLVLFVVQRLEKQFTQASKTSIGHVVQLLYRASCFKVTKRDGDSSLLQLHEKYRTYSALRKEHDAQIVQIAMEAGLHISPEQWSALLYGDDEHKSHMQSIIDKLQTPASFASSIQELIIALQRTDDPHNLQNLRHHLDKLSLIDPNTEAVGPEWSDLEECMDSLLVVVSGLQLFAKDYASKNKGNIEGAQMINTKYRTSMCRDIIQRNSCPRGTNCNFAHSEEELERYRKRRNLPVSRSQIPNNNASINGMYANSRSGSNSSPDSCCDMEDNMEKVGAHSPGVTNNLAITIPQQGNMSVPHYRPVVTSANMYQGQQQDITDSMKQMSLMPFSPAYQQQISARKEEVLAPPPRDMIKVPPTCELISQPVQPRPSPSMFQQIQYQPTYFDVRNPATPPETMYLQNNQHAYMTNASVYQHPPMPHIYPYQQEYQQYPTMFSNQQMPSHYMMRTAVARGKGGDHSDLLKPTSSELSLSIPAVKDSKEDNWKFASKNSSSSYNRIDCLDSGRGSSIGGYSSETFSPLSNASGGSRGSPQAFSDSDARKIWGDDKIWAPTDSSKLNTWSRGGCKTSSNGWDAIMDLSRLSDPEERNTSSDSVGKSSTDHQASPLEDQSYSSLKDWPRSGDLINNNNPGLLGLMSPSSTRRPPPGFNLI